eukprot:936972-Pyramimonas_sp.AAC.1
MDFTLLYENTSGYSEAGHGMLPQWVRWFVYTWLRLRYLSNDGRASTHFQWRFRWVLVQETACWWDLYSTRLKPVLWLSGA